MKSLLVLGVILVVLLISVLVVGNMTLSPIFDQINSCLESANATDKANYQVNSQLPKGQERNSKVCTDDEASIASFTNCLQKIKTKSFAGNLTVSISIGNKVKEQVTSHNKSCPNKIPSTN